MQKKIIALGKDYFSNITCDMLELLAQHADVTSLSRLSVTSRRFNDGMELCKRFIVARYFNNAAPTALPHIITYLNERGKTPFVVQLCQQLHLTPLDRIKHITHFIGLETSEPIIQSALLQIRQPSSDLTEPFISPTIHLGGRITIPAIPYTQKRILLGAIVHLTPGHVDEQSRLVLDINHDLDPTRQVPVITTPQTQADGSQIQIIYFDVSINESGNIIDQTCPLVIVKTDSKTLTFRDAEVRSNDVLTYTPPRRAQTLVWEPLDSDFVFTFRTVDFESNHVLNRDSGRTQMSVTYKGVSIFDLDSFDSNPDDLELNPSNDTLESPVISERPNGNGQPTKWCETLVRHHRVGDNYKRITYSGFKLPFGSKDSQTETSTCHTVLIEDNEMPNKIIKLTNATLVADGSFAEDCCQYDVFDTETGVNHHIKDAYIEYNGDLVSYEHLTFAKVTISLSDTVIFEAENIDQTHQTQWIPLQSTISATMIEKETVDGNLFTKCKELLIIRPNGHTTKYQDIYLPFGSPGPSGTSMCGKVTITGAEDPNDNGEYTNITLTRDGSIC